MRRLIAFATVLLAFIPCAAMAGDISTAPEPGTFELLALGGVVALVIGIRNRRAGSKLPDRSNE